MDLVKEGRKMGKAALKSSWKRLQIIQRRNTWELKSWAVISVMKAAKIAHFGD